MFYAISRLLTPLATPSTLFITLLSLGLLLAMTRARRTGLGIALSALLILLSLGLLPIGESLRQTLENRFPIPAVESPPTGIVVLGGAIATRLTLVRGGGQTALFEAGDRYVETAVLAHRFPQARIVIAAGSDDFWELPGVQVEADLAKTLLVRLGIAAERISLDRQSRNTYENAINSLAVATPKPGEKWLLVTSAYHMPRAIGVFRQIGFAVTAYPVDFETTGSPREQLRLSPSPLQGLMQFDRMSREIIGLIAYRAAGRTDALFPAP